MPDDEIGLICVAASEAATNAIEHAYGPNEGWFEVEATVEADDAVTLIVRDAGRWRPKARGGGGRGLSLIGRLMDEFRARAAARRHGSMDAPGRSWEERRDMNNMTGLVQVQMRQVGSVPVCEIQGELDASNVEHVREQIIEAATSEAPGMVIDLTETTYLDSAGVRILFELARRLRSRRQELRIAVPADGIVRRVLVLTALGDVVPLEARRRRRRRGVASARVDRVTAAQFSSPDLRIEGEVIRQAGDLEQAGHRFARRSQ